MRITVAQIKAARAIVSRSKARGRAVRPGVQRIARLAPRKRVWRVHDEPDAHGMVHVWPDKDSRDHLTSGTRGCWCNPIVDVVGSNFLVAHNALDARPA